MYNLLAAATRSPPLSHPRVVSWPIPSPSLQYCVHGMLHVGAFRCQRLGDRLVPAAAGEKKGIPVVVKAKSS